MSAARRLLNVFLVLLILGIVIGGFTMWSASKYYNTKHVLFTMNDPKGDDYGPGTYKYPTGSIFDPRKGLLDLLKFSSSELRNNYIFEMTFDKITNPWGAVEGFSHPIVEIYLADGSEEGGSVETIRQGANVTFEPRNPWNYMIKVVSFGKSAVYYSTDSAEEDGRRKGVKALLLPDKKTIQVSVPKNLLPGDPHRWKYYVLVGSLDGSGPDNFRKVNDLESQWYFSGGTDTDYNPNVIDLLASEGKQEEMLGSYSVSKRRLAEVKPVMPVLTEYTLWEKYLNKSLTMFQQLNIKL